MRRFSKKRQAIYNCLCATSSHPTADWIYHQLQPDFPDLSLGTVYRNLSQMKRDGIIQSVGIIGGQERFDGIVASHPHLICKTCGVIRDLDGIYLPETMLSSAEEDSGFEITQVQLRLWGQCPECRKSALS